MSLQHVNVKLFVDGELNVDLEEVAKQFHQWVAEQSLDDVLIDVADYQHVPEGPSLVLVGLRTQYAIDVTDGRPGLLFSQKGAVDADDNGQFAHSLSVAIEVASRLEGAFDGLKFSRTELEFAVNDRAVAPNTAESQAAFRKQLESYLQSAGHGEYTVSEDRDPRSLVGAVVHLEQPV